MPRDLIELVKEHFRPAVRHRGLDCIEEGAFGKVRIGADAFSAQFHGNARYLARASVVRREEDWRLTVSCSCPYFSTNLEPCKHLYALMLLVNERMTDAEGGHSLGPLPESISIAIDLDDDGRTSRDDRPAPDASSKQARALVAPLRLREGERRRDSSPIERLRFVIDLSLSAARRAVALTFRTDAHDAIIRLSDADASRIADPQEKSLFCVVTSMVLASRWGRDRAVRDHWLLSETVLEMVIALAAEHKRLFWAADASSPSLPLSRDLSSIHEPWKPMLHIDRDPAAGESSRESPHRVRSRLHRGSERLILPADAYVSPSDRAIVIADGVLRHAAFGSERELFETFLGSAPAITPDDLPEFINAIEERGIDVKIDWSETFGVAKRSNLKPIPILRLVPPGPCGVKGVIEGQIHFAYGDSRFEAGSHEFQRLLLPPRVTTMELVSRDEAAETAELTSLRAVGVPRLSYRNTLQLLRDEAADFATAMMARGWRVEGLEQITRRPSSTRLRVSSGIDWFSLTGSVEFGSQTIDVTRLIRAMRHGERTVTLGDGSSGELPEEWISRHGAWLSLGDEAAAGDGSRELRFKASQLGVIDLLLEQAPEIAYDETVAEARRRLVDFSAIRPTREPSTFRGTLRQYQREGLGWLEFLEHFRLGGILADDMGLGKTVQLLAHMQRCRDRDGGRRQGPWLIVAPKSLLFNWAREAKRFTPALAVIEYAGVDRKDAAARLGEADVVLTTYGTLRSDAATLREQPWEVMVLDEAQAIKTGSAQVSKAARLVGAAAQRRLALTGTPVENSLNDLWSIMEFLNPGMLGSSAVFRKLVTHSGPAAADDENSLIRRAVRPFILRRTKQVVAKELPAKTEQTIHCELSGDHKALYDGLLKHYRDSLLGAKGQVTANGVKGSRMHVLEALLRLRQAACHPELLVPTDLKPSTARGRGAKTSSKSGAASKPARKAARDPVAKTATSAKITTMMSMLEEILEEGHSVLIFSQFTSLLAIVRRHLHEASIPHEYLDGQTSQRERAAAVDRFQGACASTSTSDERPRVFVVSLKAGGVGLNLTAADYVFLLDPWWNPAAESQAIDRAHRIGQTRTVMAYRFIAAGTIEERIQELQASKRELAGAIMSDDTPADGPLASLTRDELAWLLQ